MIPPGIAADAYRRLAGAAGSAATGTAPAAGTAAPTESFGSLVENAMNAVADSARRADAQTLAAARGHADLVDVVTAVTESQTAVQALVGVRDRVISAYQQIMQMPI
jgi:flagellar hook-basal body complex protein FliE